MVSLAEKMLSLVSEDDYKIVEEAETLTKNNRISLDSAIGVFEKTCLFDCVVTAKVAIKVFVVENLID